MIREPLVESVGSEVAVGAGNTEDVGIVNVAGYSNLTLHVLEDAGNAGSCTAILYGSFSDSEPANTSAMLAIEDNGGTAIDITDFHAAEKIITLPNIAVKWLGITATGATGAQQVTVELTATAENG